MAFTNTFLFAVAAAVIGSSFQFGYNIAVCNSAEGDFFTYYSKYAYSNFWSTWVVATFAGGALIGSLLVGPMAQKFGAKGIFVPINCFSLISAICIYLAYQHTPTYGAMTPEKLEVYGNWSPTPSGKNDTAYENWVKDEQTDTVNETTFRYNHEAVGESFPMALYIMAIGRISIGIFSGMASGSAPRYIMEISPQASRGMIGVLNQLLITVGICVAQLMGMDMFYADSWPKLFILPSILSVIQLVVLFMPGMMPESPKDVLLRTDDQDVAEANLSKLRKTKSEVEDELKVMVAEAAASKGQSSLSIGGLLKDGSIRWQVYSLLIMHACQQLGGINAVFFYTNKILNQAGASADSIQYYSLGIGALNVFMTIVSTFIIEKTGRKMLLQGGYSLMIVFMIGLVFAIPTGNVTACVTAVCGYIVGFAVGPGPVPWMYNTEFFDQNARASASMLGCCTNWFCCMLVGAFFPKIQALLSQYVFAIFVGVSVVAVFWLIKFIPETKNRTVSAIYDNFAKLNGVPLRAQETVPLKETI